ncbi:MAG TPA: type II secretion system protein, partial [Candidatus Saccharibacteria bacterium]|nr:type II secretion system protein [Candidatus Saccharibacteria bacterium]
MHRQQGFTIIELMISTTIFSLVLMICLSGIMQITKMYYRGVTQARTRDVARNLIDEIAETVRFTNQDILIGPIVQGPQVNINDSSTGYFCIGPKRYTYAIDRIVKKVPASNTKEIKHALWVD